MHFFLAKCSNPRKNPIPPIWVFRMRHNKNNNISAVTTASVLVLALGFLLEHSVYGGAGALTLLEGSRFEPADTMIMPNLRVSSLDPALAPSYQTYDYSTFVAPNSPTAGSSFSNSMPTGDISDVDGLGSMSPVPEPATWVTGIVAAALLLWTQRRRWRSLRDRF